MELDPADVVELEAVRESAHRAGFGATGLTRIRPRLITPTRSQTCAAPRPRSAASIRPRWSSRWGSTRSSATRPRCSR
jgi:hypothetical protein